MNRSLFDGLFVRTELFQLNQLVYIRDPQKETRLFVQSALVNLTNLIGRGPFRVASIEDTPSSDIAPQRICIAYPGESKAIFVGGLILEISGYYLSTTLE